MSTGAIRAGGAFIEIFAQDKTSKGMQAVEQRLRAFSLTIGAIGASLTAAAGTALGGFGAALKQFSDFGSEIADSIGRTSLSSNLTQALKMQAEESGASLANVERTVARLQRTIGDAAKGNETASKQFERLGLSVSDLQRMSPDEQFLAVVEAISRITDPALRANAAFDVLGRGAASLMSIIAGGSEPIRRFQEELGRMGLLLTDDDVRMADELGDAWGRLTATLGAAVRQVGAALAPAMLKLVEAAQAAATGIATVVQNNRGLVVGAAIATVAVGGLGLALTAVGAAGLFASGVMAGFGTIVTITGAVLGAILSPIGLIIGSVALLTAGLIGLGAYILFTSETGKAGFNALWSVASQTLGGIFEAIKNGKWDLAMKVAMAGVGLAFETVVAGMMNTWAEFQRKFFESLTAIADKLSAFLKVAGKGLGVFGLDITSDAGKDLGALSRSLRELGNKSADAIERNAAKRLAEAQAALDAAIKEAEGPRDWAGIASKAAMAAGAPFGGAGGGLVTGAAASARGTFSGAAAGLLGRAGAAAPIVTAIEAVGDKIEDAVDELEEIAANTRDLGVVFT